VSPSPLTVAALMVAGFFGPPGFKEAASFLGVINVVVGALAMIRPLPSQGKFAL